MSSRAIALLVPDGVGVRNFLLGRLLHTVGVTHCVDVYHLIPDTLLELYRDRNPVGGHWQTLLPYHETARTFFLRNALVYAQMYWADTHAMRFERRRPLGGTWRYRAARGAARALGRLSSHRAGVERLAAWHHRIVARQQEVERYRRMFRETRPGVVFATHQTPLEVLAPVVAARSLGIPTATFVFSWDNLTTRGYIAAPFQHYLVWSEHMREELLRFHPYVPAPGIHIVGTPQFDPYVDPDLLWTHAEFCRRVGADPERRIICFSGGDVGTCPEDHLHLRELLQQVRDGRIAGNPQVLLRPSPVDPGDRYVGVREEFPELLFARPQWVQSERSWSRVFPLPDDLQFLCNLTHHADLNVNMASTMTLDFAIRDKPVVNVAFDHTSPPRFPGGHWGHYYQFEHYRPVVALGAARVARAPAELATHVNAYLADPSLDREGRRRLLELEVGQPIGNATERIAEVLATIAGSAR